MQKATRLVALDHALAEAKANVREVGGWNAGPRVELYQGADTLPGNHYAWCQSFQNAMWRLATGGRVLASAIVGGELLAGGTASVGIAVGWARGKGYLVSRPYRGDHFAMQLTSDSWPDHTGQIVRVLSLGSLGYLCTTVEGNTSSGEAGSIDEGDGVYVRTRFLSKSRTIFYRVPGTVEVAERQPAELLRRLTGWYAWVEWRLGVSRWKGWGPSNPNVRPDVPKRIPLTWWTRLTAFLKKQGG